ncbi:MAG: hypothetical protein MR936_14935 [Eubacterium sp.]|nr:hypothetical protein [Eubacterium sp.]
MSNFADITAEQALKELDEVKEILNSIVPDETQWTEKEWEHFRNNR